MMIPALKRNVDEREMLRRETLMMIPALKKNVDERETLRRETLTMIPALKRSRVNLFRTIAAAVCHITALRYPELKKLDIIG